MMNLGSTKLSARESFMVLYKGLMGSVIKALLNLSVLVPSFI